MFQTPKGNNMLQLILHKKIILNVDIACYLRGYMCECYVPLECVGAASDVSFKAFQSMLKKYSPHCVMLTANILSIIMCGT
jgi:hypothetical protein